MDEVTGQSPGKNNKKTLSQFLKLNAAQGQHAQIDPTVSKNVNLVRIIFSQIYHNPVNVLSAYCGADAG